MIYWMTSKTFRDEFLNNEKCKDILETQYVLISSRIGYSGKEENIISAKSFLFPSPHTCSAATNDEFENRYEEQLKNNIAFFAMIIQNALIENNDIVLLCTKCENKMKFMNIIVDFIYHKFGYFIYNYKKYSKGVLKEYKFNSLIGSLTIHYDENIFPMHLWEQFLSGISSPELVALVNSNIEAIS